MHKHAVAQAGTGKYFCGVYPDVKRGPERELDAAECDDLHIQVCIPLTPLPPSATIPCMFADAPLAIDTPPDSTKSVRQLASLHQIIYRANSTPTKKVTIS